MSYPERHTVWSATSRIGGTLAAIAIGSTTVAIAESAHAAGLDNPAYAPSQWMVNVNPPSGVTPGGVNFVEAFSSISLGAPYSSASITAAAPGTVSFGFNADLFVADSATVTVGSITESINPFVQGTTPGQAQGSRTYSVSQGDTISFVLNTNGDATGSWSIQNFDAPIPTPAMLPGLVGMGIAFWRKKMAGDQTEAAGESEVANGVEV